MEKYNKADIYLKNTLQEILNNGVKDENPRPKYEDGSLAYSFFITQKIFSFDIDKKEFPITTLRNGSLKMAFQEIKTIFIDQSNKDEDFIKNGVNWWTPWMNRQGNLGTAYSYNLESGLKNKGKIINSSISTNYSIQTVNKNEILLEKSVDGKIYQKTNNSKGFIITNKRAEVTSNGTYKYEIQFLDTGFKKLIRANDLNQNLKKGKLLKDPSSKDSYNEGYVKNTDLIDSSDPIYIKWKSLIKRCYGNAENYKDVLVCETWKCFDNFYEDIKYIPNYFLAKKDNFKGWELDKDYYSDDVKIYSKDTCTFLPKKLNVIYASKNYLKVFNKKTSEISYFVGYKDVENHTNLKHLHNSFYKKRKKGIKEEVENCEFLIEKCDFPVRYENSKNQIVELLNNLEKDKFSRRHMLSFYNWKEQEEKQLVECAFQSIFSVILKNGVNYIDQTLIQRSSDFITAGMINCSQYVMLGMIICNHLKYKTGEDWRLGKFTWFVQNCHLYNRHIESAKELINREPTGKQPHIELICEPKDFFQHTWEDFKINGTEGITPLSKKLEIAI